MIPIQWTANIQNDPELKKQFEDALRNSTLVTERLVQILRDKRTALENIQHSTSSYREPGWAYTQAHINGRRAELNELEQLLNIG